MSKRDVAKLNAALDEFLVAAYAGDDYMALRAATATTDEMLVQGTERIRALEASLAAAEAHAAALSSAAQAVLVSAGDIDSDPSNAGSGVIASVNRLKAMRAAIASAPAADGRLLTALLAEHEAGQHVSCTVAPDEEGTYDVWEVAQEAVERELERRKAGKP